MGHDDVTLVLGAGSGVGAYVLASLRQSGRVCVGVGLRGPDVLCDFSRPIASTIERLTAACFDRHKVTSVVVAGATWRPRTLSDVIRVNAVTPLAIWRAAKERGATVAVAFVDVHPYAGHPAWNASMAARRACFDDARFLSVYGAEVPPQGRTARSCEIAVATRFLLDRDDRWDLRILP